MSNQPEIHAVRQTVNHYLIGISDAENARVNIDQAFYSSTNLHTLDENASLMFQPRDVLIQMVESDQVPPHKSEILDIEITNDMAFAKVHIDLADCEFFDYLTLLKLNCGWRIVSKTYTKIIK